MPVPAAYLKGPANVLPTVAIPHWCAGKVAFDSAVLADAVAKRDRGKRRGAYFCRTCGSYHVGTAYRRAALVPRSAIAELVR